MFTKDQIIYLKEQYPDEIVSDNAGVFSDKVIDQIDEWAKDRLQMVGFDEDYAITPEGSVLEGIIDAIHDASHTTTSSQSPQNHPPTKR